MKPASSQRVSLIRRCHFLPSDGRRVPSLQLSLAESEKMLPRHWKSVYSSANSWTLAGFLRKPLRKSGLYHRNWAGVNRNSLVVNGNSSGVNGNSSGVNANWSVVNRNWRGVNRDSARGDGNWIGVDGNSVTGKQNSVRGKENSSGHNGNSTAGAGGGFPAWKIWLGLISRFRADNGNRVRKLLFSEILFARWCARILGCRRRICWWSGKEPSCRVPPPPASQPRA